MHKVEIFLPLPGMADAMIAYFKSPNVIYIDGIPVGAELPAANLTEEELLEIGFEAAQAKVAAASYWEDEEYAVDRSYPFFDRMLNASTGEHIGWEFEFSIFAR